MTCRIGSFLGRRQKQQVLVEANLVKEKEERKYGEGIRHKQTW